MRSRAFAVILFGLSMARTAAADAPTQAERDVAREIARTGAGYYDDRDWERAREHFHRAYELVKAPTLALMEARALVKLGYFVEATEAYTRAMSGGADETNEPFRRAAVDARAENDALQRRVPSIRVMLREEDSPTEVRVDGQVVSKDALRSAMRLNPGTHVIAMTRRGSPVRWESVTLGEGEERTIAVEPPPQVVADLAPHSSGSPLRPFMWTAFATGGAGLAVGIVTGVLAVDRKAKLDEMCTEQACPPAAEATLASYRDYKTVSTVGYVAGFVGVATGAVLLAVTPRASARRPQVGAFVSSTQSGVVVAGDF
jgi:hypothetical protein